MDMIVSMLIGAMTAFMGYPIIDSEGFNGTNFAIVIIAIIIWNIIYHMIPKTK